MGRLFLIDLEGIFFTCKHCNTPLALADEFISESVQGQHGSTYRFNNVVNVTFGEKEEWEKNGVLQTVLETFCVKCRSDVGWKFVREHQKVGKFFLKRHLIDLIAWWTATIAIATDA
ncbi:hypothetical protein K1719_034230 [Acacia pycnantha]|nr:hypothetical protein K1719_034230 [Acacia pycnantha]